MRRSFKVLAAVGVVAIVATGCSQMSTQPDQVGLHYKGGSFSSTEFANCQDPGQKKWYGPGDKNYYYPAGQRTFSFTGKDGSEETPLQVTTKDNQQVTIPGFVTLKLDTTCDVLRNFHEQIGLKYKAYMDGDQTSDGWRNVLEDYMFIPLQSIANTSAEQYSASSLSNDSAAQHDLASDIQNNLQAQIDTSMGGHYLDVVKVNLGRPVLPEALQQAYSDIQKAQLEQQAQLQKNKVYHDKYDTFADCQKVLTQANCLLFYAIEKGHVSILPLPDGAPLTLPAQ